MGPAPEATPAGAGPASGLPAFAAGLVALGGAHAAVASGLWFRHRWALVGGVGLGSAAFASSIGTFASAAALPGSPAMPPMFAMLQATLSLAAGAAMM